MCTYLSLLYYGDCKNELPRPYMRFSIPIIASILFLRPAGVVGEWGAKGVRNVAASTTEREPGIYSLALFYAF